MSLSLSTTAFVHDVIEPNDDTPAWDLHELVAALHDARNGYSERRDELGRKERPSRHALEQIVKDLRTALFPAHFGTPELNDASINSLVARTLDASLRELEEQVRRGLAYAVGNQAVDRDLIGRHARKLVGELAAALPKIRTALEADIRAAYNGDPAASSRAEILLCYPGITAITHHRLAHELFKLGVPLIARIISDIAHSITGIDIHPGATIDEGFFIDHGTGVVIGETTIIGRQVRIYQGVTLGARNFPIDAHGAAIKGMPRHPIIEDDVILYAGATVLGRVTIGRGATIGGNVWLTHSVPPKCNVTQAQTRNALYGRGSGI